MKNQRFFILAEPRSGSSWLMETLGSHPHIQLNGELLNPTLFPEVNASRKIKPEEFPPVIEYLEKALPSPSPADASQTPLYYTGCKILINHLEVISSQFPAYFLHHYETGYFVFLSRENMVESEVSLRLAHQTDTWHIHQGAETAKRTIPLPPDRLIKNLEYKRRLKDTFLRTLEKSGVKWIHVVYESLFAHPSEEIARVCDFLSLSPQGIHSSKEQKGNPFPLEEVISNYAEVESALRLYPYFLRMLKK